MENLMEGPHVFIEKTSSRPAAKIAYFNKAAFQAYSNLIDEHGCDGFSIEVQDIAENKLQEYFAPDFSKIQNKDAIREIGVVGSGAFQEGYDLDGFKAFGNVKGLTTHNVSFRSKLPELFPKLEAWLNLDWKANEVEPLNGSWPNLASLSLQGFSGSLSTFDGAPIKKLFLISSTIRDIGDILRFKDLETLQIVSCKIGGDVSVLSGLKQLRSLRFEGKNKLEGWEQLKSSSVENLEASHYPCKRPQDGFPKLKNYSINAYRPRDPFYEERGDFGVLGDEFSSIFN
ncbi:hypothetical protein ASG39_18395 [Rhizobium sp. Leaf371]|nr:hypothetical protein ASG39_18395 [Rhizobium sp. Leaf371]